MIAKPAGQDATARRQYTFGQGRKAASPGKPARPPERQGVPDSGRIVKLFVGQGYGFIRLANDSEIYFHRADLDGGTSINDCREGDAVRFERVDDTVSGPRARCVQRQAQRAGSDGKKL